MERRVLASKGLHGQVFSDHLSLLQVAPIREHFQSREELLQFLLPIVLNLNKNVIYSKKRTNLHKVEEGEMTKKGPQMFFVLAICVISAMAWIVFPRPISSAKIPLIPCSYRLSNHLRPLSWYSFSVPLNCSGGFTRLFWVSNSTYEKSILDAPVKSLAVVLLCSEMTTRSSSVPTN